MRTPGGSPTATSPAGVVRYGITSQAFHWITVGLVIALLAIGWGADVEADKPGSSAYMWHSSLGVIVFVLALARVLWRVFTAAPTLPAAMRRGERLFARSVHVALYAALFALPISGGLAASAEGGSVTFFGIATLPSWEPLAGVAPPAVRPQSASSEHAEAAAQESGAEQRGEIWEEAHELLAYAIAALAILHTLAALKHHFIDRDDVLRSMLPARKSGRRVESSG